MGEEVSRNPYVRPISKTWWLEKPAYRIYMARELTSVFVAGYAVVMLVGLLRLSQGQAAYDAFLAALGAPLAITFHVLALLFAVLHSVTFFLAAPAALPVQIGETRVSPRLIAGAHYGAWAIVSLGVVFLLVWS